MTRQERKTELEEVRELRHLMKQRGLYWTLEIIADYIEEMHPDFCVSTRIDEDKSIIYFEVNNTI